MKRLYWLVVIAIAVWQLGEQIWRLSDPQVYIVFCNVGQGDATLIYQGRTQILIDGGPNDRVLDCLSGHLPWFDRHLELVVNTHPEQDHLGGLPEVLRRFKVGTLVLNGLGNDTRAWRELRDLVGTKQISVYRPQIGDKLVLGELSLTALWPPASPENPAGKAQIETFPASDVNLNTLSVVLTFDYKSFNLFLSGDIGEAEELALRDRHLLTKTEVLKVPHHGSKFSSSADFLSLLQPDLAVIEVGEGNRYGHPAADALIRLEAVRARIKRTDQDGEVRLATNGDTFWLW